MPAQKINARDIVIQVKDPDLSTPTWVEIGGLTAAKPNKGENEETAETTDFASQGNYDQEIMQRGAVLELEGFEMKDPVTGVLDAGQGLCERMCERVGPDSKGDVRFRHPMDLQWTVWRATFTTGETGGEYNDKSTFEMTLTRAGKSTKASVAV